MKCCIKMKRFKLARTSLTEIMKSLKVTLKELFFLCSSWMYTDKKFIFIRFNHIQLL